MNSSFKLTFVFGFNEHFLHPPVCPRLVMGTCPHGITGKACPHPHPKFCPKFRVYGPDPNHGCKKGGKCAFFHPKLCNNSFSLRTCLNMECTKHHLKGTTRTLSGNHHPRNEATTNNKHSHLGRTTPPRPGHTTPPRTGYRRTPTNRTNAYATAISPNETARPFKMQPEETRPYKIQQQRVNQQDSSSFLLTYLENMKADLSLQLQRSILGIQNTSQPNLLHMPSPRAMAFPQCCH